MNARRTALLILVPATLVRAGEPAPGTDIDLAALPAGKDAKGSVLLGNPSPPRSASWSLGVGYTMRKLGKIRFDSGISPQIIPNLFGIDTFTEPPGIGPLGAAADHTYDDGFVNIGAGTPATGLTTFWGYNNAGQAQGGDLAYSRTGGERRDVTTRNTAAGTGWNESAERADGPFLELTYTVDVQPDLHAGVALNFSTVNVGGAQAGLTTISQFQQLDVYDVTAVDRYPLNGVVPPNAPYTGSFAGPGPLLDNRPANRTFPETLANTTTALFVDSVAEELRLDLHTIGIGGNLQWHPRPQLILAAQAGVALNLVDWRAERNEVITQSNNGGAPALFSRRTVRNDDLEFNLGLYLQGNVALRLNETWAVQVFGRYDWNKDLDGTVGPSSFEVDLSGWSLGAGALVTF